MEGSRPRSSPGRSREGSWLRSRGIEGSRPRSSPDRGRKRSRPKDYNNESP